MSTQPEVRPAAISTLVNALRDRIERDTGEPVELVETHISWVLLAGSHAYKLKKPVSLSFVDFSTLAARRHFCEEEVRLNRRLAPALYLGVEPVRGTIDAPRIGGGDGETIDYVVCMRRFSAGALFSELVVADRLDLERLDALANRLAGFHDRAPAAVSFSEFGSPEQVQRTADAVLDRLRSACAPGTVDALRSWVREQAHALRTAWLLRQRHHAVRECHGDLHLDNVVLWQGEPLAFDCVEFDPALRWIDVMNDVAFLTMDLRAHGRDDLAFRFLDAYLQCSGDYAGLTVLRFYEVYRALVRALVGFMRVNAGGTVDGRPGVDYLACAARLSSAPAHGPRLLITHGLSGSGKSTVAGQLVALTGAIRIRSDVERKRLFGLTALQPSAGRSLDIYDEDATRRTFARLSECARFALSAGHGVIVDAAFLRRDERQSFRALAASLHVPFAILDCTAEEGELRRRVNARLGSGRDASEADIAVLERQIAFHEALDAEERSMAIGVATDGPIQPARLVEQWLSSQGGATGRLI